MSTICETQLKQLADVEVAKVPSPFLATLTNNTPFVTGPMEIWIRFHN
jgi:hypothetical protein